MGKYLIQRLILMIPTLFGITVIVFVMVRLYPGDIVALIAGDFGATDATVREAVLKEFSLDKNIVQQYLEWISDVLRGDFGHSLISGRTVSSELADRLPVTVELGVLALLINVGVGIPVGIVSAIRQNSLEDYAGRSFAIGMLAAPNFWIALILIAMAGRYFQWGVPPTSYVDFSEDPISNLKFMIVPAAILGASSSGGIMRFTRTAVLEVQRQDYVRTAWAKGLPERVVIFRHVVRNALIPVVTVIGLSVPNIVGGSVIIESVYSIPGMGRLYITSINTLDFPLIQAINIVDSLAVLAANLAVDLAYSWIDPRIRYSQ